MDEGRSRARYGFLNRDGVVAATGTAEMRHAFGNWAAVASVRASLAPAPMSLKGFKDTGACVHAARAG